MNNRLTCECLDEYNKYLLSTEDSPRRLDSADKKEEELQSLINELLPNDWEKKNALWEACIEMAIEYERSGFVAGMLRALQNN